MTDFGRKTYGRRLGLGLGPFHALAGVAIAVAVACSSGGPAPTETVATQGQAFTGCGAPVTVTATADGAAGSQSFALTPRYVPSTVQATGAMWYANTKITATLTLGATTCTYESIVPQATPVDLAFVSCNDGSVPGTTRVVSSVGLSGTLNGYFGYAPLQASIGRSIDDLNVCTVDACSSGTVSNTPKSSGTLCDDGDACNGVDSCNSANPPLCVHAGGNPATWSDNNSCTTDSCTNGAIVNTPNGTCSPPSGAGAGAQDPTVPTNFSSAVSFLYTGPTPVQVGVLALTIDPLRASVVRGRVFQADGVTPLVGATVKIVSHTEYGSTLTRTDGFYDLAVNGGDGVIIEVSKTGYLTSHRHATTRWHDYSVATDILLLARDTHTKVITLGSGAWQSAQGTATTNALDPDQPSGTSRTATLLFQPGTTVSTAGFTGSTLTIRQTEYTVGGTKGIRAMPAELPPTSAYTYAVELSADEAEAQGFKSISFNQPAFFYIENFTGTNYDSTGVLSNVPTGSYDRASGMWKTEPNGIILKVVANSGTSVDLSLDGTSGMSPAQYLAYGIVAGERAALAPLYAVGKSLWRTPIAHFSPWDLNWAAGLATDAMPPPDAAPRVDAPRPDPCEVHGSIVECENQTLRESVPIEGTPFALTYSSARQAGSRPTINIPLSDARPLPATLLRVEADVSAAGTRSTYSFPPAQNQNVQWSWDRKDPYGNLFQGAVEAHVDVRYVYAPSGTRSTPGFAAVVGGSTIGGTRPSRELTSTRSYAFTLDTFDSKGLGLGGWQIDAMQAWDPAVGLVLGSRTTPVDALSVFYSKAPAGFGTIYGIAVAGDGSVYTGAQEPGSVPNGGQMGVFRISSGVRTALSNGIGCTNVAIFPDNTPLSSVCMTNFPGVSSLSDGGLLISEWGRVIRVAPGGSRLATVVAGGGNTLATPGGSARGVRFLHLTRAVEAPDGSVVFGDQGDVVNLPRVWRVKSDGKLEALAGNGTSSATPAASCRTSPDSCRGDAQPVTAISAVTVDPAGNTYFTEVNRLWRVSPQGLLRHLAGDGSSPVNVSDGNPATQVSLSNVTDLAFRDGVVYVADKLFHLVRRIGSDGIIRAVAGDPTGVATGLTGVATTSSVAGPQSISFGPDGSLYIARDWDDHSILRMSAPTPTTSSGARVVVSPDGAEVYEVDASGRHVKTRTVDGGKLKYSLAYSSGKLTSITDAGGNLTTITYGSPITIASPRNGTTSLLLDVNGYLSRITNPANESVNLVHSADGLLQQLKDPNNQTHTFVFSPSGRLTVDKNALPGTGGLKLSRSFSNNGWVVGVSSPEGRTMTHSVDFGGSPSNFGKRIELRSHSSPPALTATEERYSDLGRKVTMADGTTVETLVSADPRFGASSPYLSSTTTTSGGKMSTVKTARVVTGATGDPFSFTSEKETTSFSAVSADARNDINVVYAPGTPSTRTRTTYLGRQVVEQLDSYDRVTKITVPGVVPGAGSSTLVPVDFYYDGNGRLWKMDQNGGVNGSRTTTMTFASGKDWIDSITRPLGVTGFENFDGVGRPRTTNLPGHVAVTNPIQLLSQYDFNGNTTKITVPLSGGRDHWFSSTAEDLLGLYTPPTVLSGGATSYGYDRDNLLMSVREPGTTATYVRDDMGRVTSIAYPAPLGAELVTKEYDSAGRLWKVNAAGGNVNLTYTYSGKMKTKESYTGAFAHDVNFTYDDYLRLKTRNIDADPTTSATFAYEADGLLSQVTGSWGTYKVFRTSGSAGSPVNGMLTGTELGGPNGLTDVYEYDVFGALKHYTLKFNGSIRYEVLYSRDAKGRVQTKAETIWTLNGNAACSTTYGYDSGGRGFLVSDVGTCPGSFAGPVNYDKDGNPNVGTGGSVYDAQDRLVTDANWNYTYNPDGDQINGTLKTDSYNQWQYDFDVFGNLRRYYGPYYSSWYPATYPPRTYKIDGLNRRVGILDDTGSGATFVSQLIYDGDRIVGMYRAGTMGHYVYGTKQHVPDLLLRPDGAYRVVSDQLGSVKLVIKADGTVVEARNYDAWGAPLSTAGAGLWKYAPFGFAGGLWDERANRVRFGARDYSPWGGSNWVSRDPSRFAGGFNLYTYANNDPVNFYDRTGRFGEFAGGVVGGELDRQSSEALAYCSIPGMCLIQGPQDDSEPCDDPGLGAAIRGSRLRQCQRAAYGEHGFRVGDWPKFCQKLPKGSYEKKVCWSEHLENLTHKLAWCEIFRDPLRDGNE
ncbi:hypothetical protein BH09MYX1_BH09MYX1_21170 [soil metagenome]